MMIFLIVVILVLVLNLILLARKCSEYEQDLYDTNDLNTFYSGKLSMIEYHYRKYKEGENPFVVLRKLGDIIQYVNYDKKQEFKG